MIELPSPCLLVMVGVPGSGKSTWASTNLPGSVVSSDDLRALAGEGPHDQRASIDAFELVDDVVRRRLRRRLTTVIDSIGTDPERRAVWRRLAADAGVPCVAVVLDTPPALVRRRNRERELRVPDRVVAGQLAAWPAHVDAVRDEPFDAVHVITVEADRERVSADVVLTPSSLRAAPGDTGSQVGDVGRPVRFGLHVPVLGAARAGAAQWVRAVAGAADEAGLDDLWFMDHLRQIPMHGPPWADILEPWAALAHVAASTERIRLGTLVTPITFRSVPQLAKLVATVDVLSAGRVTCGLGLGSSPDEHVEAGLAWPSLDERYDLLADALELLPRLWGPGNAPYVGRRLHVPDTTCYPRPLQTRVPLLVGGSGERRTLRLAARAADACNLFGDEATVRRKVAVLADHCRAAGRHPAEVSVSHLSTVMVADDPLQLRDLVDATRPRRTSAERHARTTNAGTIEQHVARISRLVEAGVDHVIVSLHDLGRTPDPVEAAGVVRRWARVADAWRSAVTGP